MLTHYRQGFGQLGGAIVMVCLVSGFKGKLEKAAGYGTCVGECRVAVDQMWRALIGIGIVPACIALYYRLTIPETPRYTFDVARDVEKANEDAKQYLSGKHGEGKPDEAMQVAARRESVTQLDVPKASFGDFFRFYGKLKNGKILFGTAMSWLLLDVSYALKSHNRSFANISCTGCLLWSWFELFYRSSSYRIWWRFQRLPQVVQSRCR